MRDATEADIAALTRCHMVDARFQRRETFRTRETHVSTLIGFSILNRTAGYPVTDLRQI